MSYPKSVPQPEQTNQSMIPELVSDLRGDSRFAPVIETFLGEFPTLLEDVAAAAARKDLSAVRLTAHKLKGAAGSAGFARLSDLACQVEDYALQSRLDAIPPLMDQLTRIGQSATLADIPST